MTAKDKPAEWWRPPSKRQQARLQRILLRQVDRVSPESRLVVAVIALAMMDAQHPHEDIRRDARRFLRGRGLGQWCDLVGLEETWVRELAERGGWLAPVPDVQRQTAPASPPTEEVRHA